MQVTDIKPAITLAKVATRVGRRRRTSHRLRRGLLSGAAAGAVGTTALDVVTYLDMVTRGRPTSSTPEDSIEALSRTSHIPVPGDDATRANRVAGLGALTGLFAGVGVGAVLGLTQSAGWRPRRFMLGLAATALVLAAGNGPMTVLGVTDPKTWSATDWVSDLVPHAAYGVTTAWVLQELAER
ncbi:hypothetical protein [Wenjunlia tyrosinilytica]|uniref:Uncharacterized protein n=1 Tax=Wenjunlia tyrosinilytica TaxID=1544741 RepID=A0A917ZSE5_9ACTN|nr:hypothetical protein [Wenjunlia tyrosinilytica]GGO90297.1 hypothetical protein GCM10012280_35500 [Wenjunlia tyrosinilytica]